MNDPRDDEPKGAGKTPDDLPHDPPLKPAAEEPAKAPAADPPPPPASAPGEATAARSFGIVLGFFALLVAFAAGGGALYTWWQLGEQRVAVADERAEAADRYAAMRALVAAAEERLAHQERQLSTLDRDADERRRRIEGLDAELRQARARLEAITREDAGPERSPSLAEIEFLLLLARRELVLADNPRVALAALREADQRVARLDDPGLARVRAAINDEITAIEAVATIDLEGIALRLASLARRIDGLPLRGTLAPDARTEAAVDPDATGWDRLVDRARTVASNLFRIRRTDAPAAPLLAPDESFFLYRNVELDLKSARLAVLSRDPDNYAAGLEAARRALQDYFETGDEAVRSLLEAIEALEGREIAPVWPEIDRSLQLLRAAGTAD
jgi:uroporphyrin-III C-methyltransferase